MSALEEIYEVVGRFLQQAQTDSLKTKDLYPQELLGCKLNVSFGQGNQSHIPWIALTKNPNKVNQGIYPVLLYYKSQNLLMIAYGISEENPSHFSWDLQSPIQTIREYFLQKYAEEPRRYGASFVFQAYELNGTVVPDSLAEGLIALTEEYLEHDFSEPESVTREEPFSVQEAFEQIDLELITNAVEIYKQKGAASYGPSSTYDVIIDDTRYPPKAIAGLAAGLVLNREVTSNEFSGGLGMPCFRVFERLGFLIEPKRIERKYWLYAPGKNADKWDEFYNQGIIALGWNEIGDLREFQSRDEISSKLRIANPEVEGRQTNSSLALWEFVNKMQIGDIVIPKKGKRLYLGYGIITSDYFWSAEADTYTHQRMIDWKKKGTWQENIHPIVTKTLTDITKYPPYVDRLRRQIGIEQKESTSTDLNYWWLNASPRVWRINDWEIGSEQFYTTHNDRGNKRQKYQYFTEAQTGDLVIGYESSPTKKAVAILEVTTPLFIDDEDGLEKLVYNSAFLLHHLGSIERIGEP